MRIKKLAIPFALSIAALGLVSCGATKTSSPKDEISSDSNATECTISFFSCGGTAIAPKKISSGTLLTLPTTTREGYTFAGWYTDGLCTTAFDASVPVTESICLYAKWTAVGNDPSTPEDTLFNVVFNTNGGTAVSSQKVKKNNSISSVSTSKDGYDFAGWYEDSTFTVPFSTSAAITKNMTLYAKWTAKITPPSGNDEVKYTITFDSKGGSTVQSQTVKAGATASTPVPVRSGYTFGGWFLDSSCTQAFTTATAVNSNITLYAKWTAAQQDPTPSDTPTPGPTPGSFENATGAINFLSASGDQETLFATFKPVEGATEYAAYVSENGSTWTKLDEQLIRLYKNTDNYYRVDAVGLKKGTYSIKVNPVVDGVEDATKGNVVSNINVVEYDRTGFAFSTMSELKGVTPGAYNADGTIKSNAIVLYVTEANKNTVSCMIHGKSGDETVTGVGNITKAYSDATKAKKETRPLVIRIIGKVTQSGLTNSNDSLNLGFKEANSTFDTTTLQNAGITIEGIGDDATLFGAGVRILKTKNAEIRNLGLIDWPDDGIALEGSNINIWVHDNDIFYGHPGSDSDQKKGDGSMDLKDNSKFITISYMHFWDSGKMSLCGMKSESGENWISYHHNWFDHSDSRHPRVRTMTVHVYNNYYDGNSKYGIGLVKGAQCFAEGNYFRNCKNPVMVGGFGTDANAEKTTFSGEVNGFCKMYNNHIEGAKSLIYANVGAGVNGSTAAGTATNSDAYLASTRSEQIASTYTNGVAYSNFDTNPSVDLGVTGEQIQSPEAAKVTTMTYSGRVSGGDLKYTFNNSSDDTSDVIDTTLQTMVLGYKSKMVSVQGI